MRSERKRIGGRWEGCELARREYGRLWIVANIVV